MEIIIVILLFVVNIITSRTTQECKVAIFIDSYSGNDTNNNCTVESHPCKTFCHAVSEFENHPKNFADFWLLSSNLTYEFHCYSSKGISILSDFNPFNNTFPVRPTIIVKKDYSLDPLDKKERLFGYEFGLPLNCTIELRGVSFEGENYDESMTELDPIEIYNFRMLFSVFRVQDVIFRGLRFNNIQMRDPAQHTPAQQGNYFREKSYSLFAALEVMNLRFEYVEIDHLDTIFYSFSDNEFCKYEEVRNSSCEYIHYQGLKIDHCDFGNNLRCSVFSYLSEIRFSNFDIKYSLFPICPPLKIYQRSFGQNYPDYPSQVDQWTSNSTRLVVEQCMFEQVQPLTLRNLQEVPVVDYYYRDMNDFGKVIIDGGDCDTMGCIGFITNCWLEFELSKVWAIRNIQLSNNVVSTFVVQNYTEEDPIVLENVDLLGTQVQEGSLQKANFVFEGNDYVRIVDCDITGNLGVAIYVGTGGKETTTIVFENTEIINNRAKVCNTQLECRQTGVAFLCESSSINNVFVGMESALEANFCELESEIMGESSEEDLETYCPLGINSNYFCGNMVEDFDIPDVSICSFQYIDTEDYKFVCDETIHGYFDPNQNDKLETVFETVLITISSCFAFIFCICLCCFCCFVYCLQLIFITGGRSDSKREEKNECSHLEKSQVKDRIQQYKRLIREVELMESINLPEEMLLEKKE